MFSFELKSRSKYVLVAIIIFIIISLWIELKYPDLHRIEAFIIAFIIPSLIFYGFEKDVFTGRYTNRALLYWLLSLVIFILVGISAFMLIGSLLKSIGLIMDSELIKSTYKIIGASFIFYFLFKLLQLFYKRFQDYNQPGYYFILGLFPISCWVIGIKIYKSGERVLGLLVFLNSAISILYVTFGIGNDYSNYFGMNPELKDDYNKEKRMILKNKFLSDEEKQKLIIALRQKYSEFESKELSEFRTLEIARRLKKEMKKFKFVSKDAILTQEMQNEHQQRIIDFHSKFVDGKIIQHYKYTDWN